MTKSLVFAIIKGSKKRGVNPLFNLLFENNKTALFRGKSSLGTRVRGTDNNKKEKSMSKIKQALVLALLVVSASVNAQSPATFAGLPDFNGPWYYLVNSFNTPWYQLSSTTMETSLNGTKNSFLYIDAPNHYDAYGLPVPHTVAFSHYSKMRGPSGIFSFLINGSPKLVMPYENYWSTYSITAPAANGPSVRLGWAGNGVLDEYLGPVQWTPIIQNPLVIHRFDYKIFKISWSPIVYPGLNLYYAYSIIGPWYPETTTVNTVVNGFNYVMIPASEAMCFFTLR